MKPRANDTISKRNLMLCNTTREMSSKPQQGVSRQLLFSAHFFALFLASLKWSTKIFVQFPLTLPQSVTHWCEILSWATDNLRLSSVKTSKHVWHGPYIFSSSFDVFRYCFTHSSTTSDFHLYWTCAVFRSSRFWWRQRHKFGKVFRWHDTMDDSSSSQVSGATICDAFNKVFVHLPFVWKRRKAKNHRHI